MVAVVLLGMWLLVIAPFAIVELVGRRRHSSTLTAWQAAIRGLDRSSASAVAVVGPNLRPPRRTPAVVVSPSRTPRQRQHVILALGLVLVAVTLAGVAVSFGRTSLAIHAFVDQCVIAYATAVVAVRQRRHQSASTARMALERSIVHGAG